MGVGAAMMVVRLMVVGAGDLYWAEREEEDGADRIEDAEERPPPLPPERPAMISEDPKLSSCCCAFELLLL